MKKTLSLVIFLFLLFSIFNGCKAESMTLITELSSIKSVNYNNYSRVNNLDAYGGIVVFVRDLNLLTKMTIYMDSEKIATIKGAISDCQISCGGVYYRNNNNLFFFDVVTRKNKLIKENALDYCVFNNETIYVLSKGEIIVLDTSATELKRISNVEDYIVSKDKLYYVDSNKMLKAVSHDDFSVQDICKVDVNIFNLNVCGSKLIYVRENAIVSVDLSTGELNRMSASVSAYYKMDIVCDVESIYLTTHKMNVEDSLPEKLNDENNGVWKINYETGEKTKISDKTYDQLYLFDDILFGFDKNKGITDALI